ncbi:MAG: T9SS type A sorting domain-containing protein [candidate division Zixibacteria bacterium]|nr:T9SS type A sorting domain-containing protein [candidate division Zixibacteria bacterium]
MKPLRQTLIGAAIVSAGLMATAARGENAIRFSDASGTAGQSISVDVIIENDVILAGAVIYFRWTSPDLNLDSIAFLPGRWLGNVTALRTQTDLTKRTSGILVAGISTNSGPGWFPVDSAPVARLYFTISPNSSDQYCSVDSVYEVSGGVALRQVSFSDYPGNLIRPNVYPALIRIGSPASIEVRALPTALRFEGMVGGVPPAPQTLSIGSTGDVLLDWGATWSSSWLAVGPSSSIAPSVAQVSVDLFSLPGGLYRDTIVIHSPAAANSPLYVLVTLKVDTVITHPPPPPESTAFMSQNGPNPFVTYRDQLTEIRYGTAKTDHVQIRIYDTLGRPVRTLLSGQVPPGESSVQWDGRDENGNLVASGRYFYRMISSTGAITKRMIVIK